jgi:hypothetical protein
MRARAVEAIRLPRATRKILRRSRSSRQPRALHGRLGLRVPNVRKVEGRAMDAVTVQSRRVKTILDELDAMQCRVATRAFELFQRRGSGLGHC